MPMLPWMFLRSHLCRKRKGWFWPKQWQPGLRLWRSMALGGREVVRDGLNGRLLRDATAREFAQAMVAFAELPEAWRLAFRLAA